MANHPFMVALLAGGGLATTGLAIAPTPAMAQDSKPAEKPSVEAYLCTFAGKCDGVETPVETRDAPDTKGFRLARPATSKISNDAVKPAQPAPARLTASRKSRATRSAAPARANAGRSAAQLVTSDIATTVLPGTRADLRIGFELGSARLTSDGVEAATIFARSMTMPELLGKKFLIEGHTDISGSRAMNIALSTARAKEVARFLMANGVASDRLQIKGFGPDAPLPGRDRSDPDNRRVEAKLIS